MITLVRSLKDCTYGAVLLETTVVVPLLLTLMVGVVDLGRAIQVYHTADKAVRDATRYLARVSRDHVCDWGWSKAQHLAGFGSLNPPRDAQPLIVGWTVGTLSLDRNPDCASAPALPMTIAITAEVPIATPVISAIGLPSSITVRVRHEERHVGD